MGGVNSCGVNTKILLYYCKLTFNFFSMFSFFFSTWKSHEKWLSSKWNFDQACSRNRTTNFYQNHKISNPHPNFASWLSRKVIFSDPLYPFFRSQHKYNCPKLRQQNVPNSSKSHNWNNAQDRSRRHLNKTRMAFRLANFFEN